MKNIMVKYKKAFIEWLVYTMIFFFLYDVIWIFADISDFRESLNEDYLELFVDFVLCGIFSLTSECINRWLFMQNKFRKESRGHRFFLLNGMVVLLFNLIVAGGCELFLSFVLPTSQVEDIWGTSFLFGLIASLVALIHLSMHFSDMVVQKGKENIALQKKYLKLQLDPHFVFNSLSSLAGMIEESPQMAEEYVVKLSHIYRHILHHIDKNYITISEGADFIKNYITLLNMRYNNNIVLKIDDMNGHKDEFILSLSLQLLIENAVKHNCPQEDEQLQIELFRQDGMLVVKNNRIYKNKKNNQSVESYGLGIGNLKQRYNLECGNEPKFIISRDYFEVKLPILSKKWKNNEKSTNYRR